MKTILKYLRKYWLPALLASAFMIAEVYVDLYQPRMMAVIVDEGILGVGNNGVSNLSLILSTGVRMLLVVLAGVLPVSMNVMVSIKKPLSGVLISLSKQLVLILLLLLLPRFLGINGVLLAGPCADFLVAVAAFVLVRSAFRQLEMKSSRFPS